MSTRFDPKQLSRGELEAIVEKEFARRRAMSRRMKARWDDPDERARLVDAARRGWETRRRRQHSAETKAKISAGLRAYNEERRRRLQRDADSG